MSSSAKILLVEDDNDLRGVLRQILEARNYVVAGSSDCRTAIQRLQDETFDLVLLDIGLPDKSGFEVLEYIRDNGLCSKVIMLTGTVGLQHAVRSAKLGVTDYITKPFAPHYLLRSIEDALATGSPEKDLQHS